VAPPKSDLKGNWHHGKQQDKPDKPDKTRQGRVWQEFPPPTAQSEPNLV
jgi:hypothetical protein